MNILRNTAVAGAAAAPAKRKLVSVDNRQSRHDDERLVPLLARIAAADRTALEQFYDLTVARAYGVARCICHDSADAEATVEDVYVDIWWQAHRAAHGSVLRWLLRLVRDTALKRARPHVAACANLLPMVSPDSAMHRALAQLTERERMAVSAAFLRDSAADEIARLLDTTESAAASVLRAGIRKLSQP